MRRPLPDSTYYDTATYSTYQFKILGMHLIGNICLLNQFYMLKKTNEYDHPIHGIDKSIFCLRFVS